MNGVSQLNPITAPVLSQPAPKAQQAAEDTVKPQASSSSLAADIQATGQVKRGVVPSLKGAQAGLLKTGLAVALPATALAVMISPRHSGQALKFAGVMALGGGAIGAVGGATAANFTLSKGQGALMGAGTGAVAGAVLLTSTGVFTKDLGGMLAGAAIGSVLGAIGGYAGAKVAEEK